jgi:uncharacterized RDD family membrane protein YckC
MAYAGTGTVARADYGYGGFLIRVLAAIIDGGILGIVQFVLNQVIDDFTAINLLNTLVAWLYFALLESSSSQATLGKMVLGLKVTGLDGDRITFLRATGRYVAKILSALILLIGFLMVAFTEKKQGLHDLIAGTLVVKTR